MFIWGETEDGMTEEKIEMDRTEQKTIGELSKLAEQRQQQ